MQQSWTTKRARSSEFSNVHWQA